MDVTQVTKGFPLDCLFLRRRLICFYLMSQTAGKGNLHCVDILVDFMHQTEPIDHAIQNPAKLLFLIPGHKRPVEMGI